MSSPSEFRVAIAGCHRQTQRKPGSHNWATAFDAVEGTSIAAVFDLGAETRQEFLDCWGDVPAHEDYEQMLREVRPDIVCIATRQTMHADQVELAIEHGVRGLLIDKPLATSLEEADRIHRACRENGVPLAFGLDRRWWRSYHCIRELIARGDLGEVVGATAYALPNLINHGCHWYDTLMLLLGDPEPKWVSGFVDDVSGEPPESMRRLDPSGRAQVGFDGDVVAYITPSGGPRLAFEIVGTEDRLMVINDGREAFLFRSSGGEGDGARPVELPAMEEGWPAGPAMVRDLVGAVAQGGRTSCDIEQARRATEIGFAIHESSAGDGVRVSLPLVNRSGKIDSYPWGNE